jgi:hypothetical protein
MKPLAIDLFCGLGGWTEGLMAEGYEVVGFDNVCHVYGQHHYPAQLVLQDVLTLVGSQFKDAALIVASPPCQAYSYRAMPWKRAKALPPPDNGLFDACFRIQREACAAAGRHIPLVVENVKGAQPYVGRARWNYGSYYLWGDVPALMPITLRTGYKTRGQNWSRHAVTGEVSPHWNVSGLKNTGGSWFNHAHNTDSGTGYNPVKRNDPRDHIKVGPMDWSKGFGQTAAEGRHEREGVKQGGTWFQDTTPGSLRSFNSKSNKRKMASALIAKIPLVLSRHIARAWYPK